MTKLVIENLGPTHEINVVFANTGQEHPATLDFIKECDERLGFGTVWLEAVVDPTIGNGVRHRIVTYETASRDGRPFRDYIAKYGIPNMGNPSCTARLKENVMESYLRSIGWKNGTYKKAIGIRADEAHRMSARAAEAGFIYPLVGMGYTKEKVVQHVRSWGFDLTIPEHLGNCTWCWKKSWRKLLTVAKNNPEFMEFPAKMEKEFGGFKVTPATASPDGRRNFFRGHRTTTDLMVGVLFDDFEEFTDKHHIPYDERFDFGVGCGESCEVGSDERYGVEVPDEEEITDEDLLADIW